ncbi:MAG TPA: IPT/TIG domain-containing protein [Vicinamibacterales bacterium]|nr:IPT/TIG domain-containing protein [Vicinamibacterales bacterium]
MTTRYASIVLLAVGMAGCGTSPASPVAASSASGASVTALSPAVGSTRGSTQVTLKGEGLGTTVRFGDTDVVGRFDSRYPGALMILHTPPHQAGAVNITVTDAAGRRVMTSQTFTFAPPETFDFNGRWSGFGWNGQDNPIEFTVRDNGLVDVLCDSELVGQPGTGLTFSPPRPVSDSAFSVSGDGMAFSGRIVAPNMATGTIRLGECSSDAWYAVKK